jgi:hypothetical protein
MKGNHFEVIVDSDIRSFKQRVQQLLEQGWKLAGSMVVYQKDGEIYFAQSLCAD